MAKEAILYEKLSNNKVRCTACARYCELKEEQMGLCGIRGNQNGKLDLFVYGKVIAGHVDPIEKKTCDTLLSRLKNIFNCYHWM
jgi:pyruvate formate lyase activating enzyme